MTLPDDEHYEEEAIRVLSPRGTFQETTTSESHAPPPDKPSENGLSWLLPDGSNSDSEGRRGFLSTRTEIHALVLGITAGAHFGLNGDTQLLNDILGLGMASDRTRRAQYIPDKYRNQAKQELPYFVIGVAIGTGLTRANVPAELGVGV